MEAISAIDGVGVPLRASNVDTDQIIPAVYLKRVTQTGFEDALFAGWRKDPAFVLNEPAYAGAQVLVAGPDFGTGSSREHAVWALRDYGFKAVLSARFGDIFRGNAGKKGVLAAVVEQPEIERIQKELETAPGTHVKIDVAAQTISCGSVQTRFEIDSDTKHRLLNGLDDIRLTLESEGDIAAFESRRPTYRPRTLPSANDEG
ncbi:3-isopropylmalate dehydratase small subunit [Falsarthrobacter nasiphocae]|uniref:3-isopropylmalate dehydratase small subunit n=1 Tax=Falsarthrobacter nasiphocae TaxID=189863 RepID=A0AAE3YII6_9MICC|nr:3-isopropylmalate dehydratase small subunit [Falsarthrobacter nasiphocae]MDR6892835.1 3-isopropylmalate/(R)-2-methylmalate dehydratase small subunit [Falsarthrobacter nasiphocae]